MGFIEDIYEAAVDTVTDILDVVIQIVEEVIAIVMSLLGFEDQIIEYYDVQNIQLFPTPDSNNSLANIVTRSILTNEDIAGNLIYASAFRSLKGNLRKFIKFIDDGLYFEGFPAIESRITTVDYDELTAALTILRGVPCTPEHSGIRALTRADWVKYWLQENKDYDVGLNQLPGEYANIITTPASTSSSYNVEVTGSDIQVTITDEIAVSDDMLADTRWYVDFNSIVYNEGPDDYTVGVYNEIGDEITLPYVVPSRPLQMHYVSIYYLDSDPSRLYIFIYKIGTSTYPDLDDPEDAIDIDATTLQAIPAIPLRISNENYTTFGETKAQQIVDLCDLVSLDPQAMLDAVLDDPGVAPGDIDNIYITFGVRMWDTSHAGLAYMFNMFENLFPAQSVTKGIYDGTAAGDEKPYNNIIITTEDYKYAFEFAYITFEHFTVPEIDADSGSVENGIYYSDMSKFNGTGDLVYPYYISSGKGTYNVGYKADDLDEVALFLAGNGVVNPGDTTGEATDWLQVTTRMRYTEPLKDPDGSDSELLYLTADMVYKNSGGILRLVNAASEETTAGQSITYYYATETGLDAYTVVAPIGALRVEDGDTGHFRMVKFNLGARDDLIVPFVYSFVTELSNKDMTQLFLTGTHMSIYIAHYEVIEASFWDFLLMIVIIVIVLMVAWYMAPEVIAASTGALTTGGTAVVAGTPVVVGTTTGGVITATTVGGVTVLPGAVVFVTAPVTGIVTSGIVGTVGFSVAWAPTLLSFATSFAINQIVKFAVTTIAEDNPELAAALGIIAAATMGSYQSATGTFQMPDIFGIMKTFALGTDYISIVVNVYVENEYDDLQLEYDKLEKDTNLDLLQEIAEDLFRRADGSALSLIDASIRSSVNPMLPEDYFALHNTQLETQYVMYDHDANINMMLETPTFT